VFKVDGVGVGTDSTAPYSIAWDSTSVVSGSHTVTATASGVGGSATSSGVFVTTSNAAFGNLWVDTSGGTCTNSATLVAYNDAAACGSLGAAMQAVNSDHETIVVKPGTYSGAQTIFPNAAVTSNVLFKPETAAVPTASACNPATTPCFANVVRVAASHVEMDNFRFDYTPSTDGTPCPSAAENAASHCTYTPGFQVTIPDSTGSGATWGYACTTDVTIKNAFGHAFAIHNGTSNVNFIGGTWGYIGYHTGERNDGSSYNAPQIGGSPNFHCPNVSTTGAPATNVTFDGVRFGNDFQGCTAAAGNTANCQYPLNPCTATAFSGGATSVDCSNPSHVDCLHLFGETIGLTIKNSRFDRCFGFYLNMNTEKIFVSSHVVDPTQFAAGCDPTNVSCTVWGEMKDAVIENNWFGDATPSDAQTVQILDDNEPTPVANAHTVTVCDNDIFRNNTFVYNGQTTAFSQFAIKCPVKAGATVGLQFYSNYFKNSVAPTGCVTAAPYSVVWDYNVFDSATTVCGTHTATTSDPKLTQTVSTAGAEATGWTYDLHLLVSSPLLGAGSPTNSSPITCDGVAWSGSPNAGAC
jgi:hypothetical protein